MRPKRLVLLSAILASVVAALGAPEPASGQDPEGGTALAGISAVAAGRDFSCARAIVGTIYCWGGNSLGELGRGHTTHPAGGVANVRNEVDSGPLAGVSQVTTGASHACALLGNRQVRCWGDNADRQLGSGSSAPYSTLPVPVLAVSGPGNLNNVQAISAEQNGTCALLRNGQVRCWGDDDFGQLGNGAPRADRNRPVVVKGVGGQGALQNVTQIDGGWDNSCARLRNGQARCWGFNNGALGNGATASTMTPVVVRAMAGTPGPLTGVSHVSAGGYTTCARLRNAQARCWGRNTSGALGNNTTTPTRRPTPVLSSSGAGRLSGVARITVGNGHTCALVTGNQVRCWGQRDSGQVGDATVSSSPRLLPTPVVRPNGTTRLTGVTDLRTIADSTCARIGPDGNVACWGLNASGQVDAILGGSAPRSTAVNVQA